MKRLVSLLPITVSMAVIATPADGMSRGEALFRAHCIGCHSFGCNRTGPKLQNVFGRRAGSLAEFGSYSEGLKSSGIVWSEETLDDFIRDPYKRVPGTRMAGIVINDPRERQQIIAFVRRQDTSVDICF
jgi:cytochrome c